MAPAEYTMATPKSDRRKRLETKRPSTTHRWRSPNTAQGVALWRRLSGVKDRPTSRCSRRVWIVSTGMLYLRRK